MMICAAVAPRRLLQAAHTMGVPRTRILLHVLLPASLPSVLLGARLGMGMAWTAIIAAELAVGAKSGGGTSGRGREGERHSCCRNTSSQGCSRGAH
jgi:ABC-type nitrate/sulfonate/bicarbonate transport system permease component